MKKTFPVKTPQVGEPVPTDIGALPKEVCETINGSWGFNLQDKKHKSDKELIQYLINAAGYGSNLLLNVGPMPNGKIQPEHISLSKEHWRLARSLWRQRYTVLDKDPLHQVHLWCLHKKTGLFIYIY